MLHIDGTREYIAVDWGSTNRRAYRVSNGAVVDGFSDDLGVLAVAGGGFDRPVSEIRERLGDLPMLLAGMVGSNKGWHEVGYVTCPAGAEDIAGHIHWVDNRTGIIPGVSQINPPDVMRGEEVQVIGAPDGLICHPGTHTKWINMADGRVTSFRTAMTGEMFSLLKDHSILADLLQGDVFIGPALDAGISDALQHKPILTSLFAIRARHLLTTEKTDHASYASGLLIGADIAAAIGEKPGVRVSLVGRPDLCALYARALSVAGWQSTVTDGTKAFIKGMTTLTGYLK